jgi:hypothetical protein
VPSSQILARRILGKPFNAQQFKPRPRLLEAGTVDLGGVQTDDSLDQDSPTSQASTVNNIYPSPYAYDEMGRGMDSSVGGDTAVSSDRPAPITGPSKGSDPSTSIDVPFFGGSRPDNSYDRTSPGQPPMGGGMAPGTASPTSPRPRVGIPIPGYNTSGGAFEGGGAMGQGAGGPGAGGPISRRFEDVAANPVAYGADPKSSFLRRLGGAAIDIAGTWGGMFGVPRNLTHHLAEDVRYGADAAHQKENYYQNLPLLQAAATMEEKNRQLDEQTQYRMLQQNNLNAYRDQMNATRQEQADTRKDQAVDQAYERQPGFIPLPPAAPGIPSTTPIASPSAQPPTPAGVGPVPSATAAAPTTPPPPLMSIPQMTGGMSPQQQRRPGYVPAYIPQGTTTPAIEGQRPSPETLEAQKAGILGKNLIDTLPELIEKGFPAKMTESDIVRGMLANGKEKPLKDMYEEILSAPPGTYPPDKVQQAQRFQRLHLADNPSIVVNANKQSSAADDAQVYVDSMLEGNPDIYHDIKDPVLKKAVDKAWTKQTNLPPPAAIGAQTKTMEEASQIALQHVANVRQLISDPAVQKRLGPILGRLGSAEQDIGATANLTPEEAQKVQDMRSSLTYLFLREGRALFGGRPPEMLMKQLQSTSPKPAETMPLLTGALGAIERSARSTLLTGEKQRFGGQIRPGYRPGYDTSNMINPAPASLAIPAIGTVKGGYRFKGGDPADKASWEPVKAQGQ